MPLNLMKAPKNPLAILVRLDPTVGMARKAGEAGATAADKIEARPAAYHQRVREGFLQYAKLLGQAAVVLDADQPVEDLHLEILRAVGLND